VGREILQLAASSYVRSEIALKLVDLHIALDLLTEYLEDGERLKQFATISSLLKEQFCGTVCEFWGTRISKPKHAVATGIINETVNAFRRGEIKSPAEVESFVKHKAEIYAYPGFTDEEEKKIVCVAITLLQADFSYKLSDVFEWLLNRSAYLTLDNEVVHFVLEHFGEILETIKRDIQNKRTRI
jgi:hypothetical protein